MNNETKDGTLKVSRPKDGLYKIYVLFWDGWAGQNGKWYTHFNMKDEDLDRMVAMGLDHSLDSDVISYVDKIKRRPYANH